jgi:uncharacterized iron-regulated protein
MRLLATLLTSTTLAACASVAPPPTPMDRILPELRQADVVFYGEEHGDRRQHAFERDLLQALDARDGRPTLLGMEMFQRPFQAPLDDYVAGAIDEKEMLRRTQYFDRWRFDFTFYAPLWRYCREHGVRIVALNAEASIVRDVNQKGLAALSADQRAQVAADVDLSVAKHRKRIVEVFRRVHPMPPDAEQKMYEAMTVWDESMAESAARAIDAAGPGARMLVVAGRGHIEDFTGIPDRVARRAPGLRRVVVVGERSDKAEAPPVRVEDGQFVVAFPEIEDPPAPKLGVTFDSTPSAAGLLVTSVTPGGAAAAAGVVAGDRLARLAGAPVTDLTDVRFVVDPAATGDVVFAEVLRDGAVVAVAITLTPPPAAPAASTK